MTWTRSAVARYSRARSCRRRRERCDWILRRVHFCVETPATWGGSYPVD